MNRGKLSENALTRSVIRTVRKQNSESNAGVGVDAGFSSKNEKLMFSCAGISGNDPLLFYLAVFRCVNSMAAAGGRAEEVIVSVAAPASDSEEFVKNGMKEAARACGLCNVKISSGNTTVTGNEQGYVSVTAVGSRVYEFEDFELKNSVILMTGYAGATAAALLSAQHEKKLTERLSKEYVEKCSNMISETESFGKAFEILEATGGRARLHDISEGGVFGALWEICEREKVGCEVEVKCIPIKQATVEVTELLNISPYQIFADGAFLAIVPDEPEFLSLGKVIGRVTDNNDRKLINGSETRFLEPNRVDYYYSIEDEKNEK